MKNFFGPKSPFECGALAAASRRTPKILVALLVVVFAICAVGDEVSDSRKLQQEAIAAFKAKDFPVFLEKIHAAAALRPQHPSMQYQLATAYALNGRTDEALDVLERVARMGFDYPAAKDENLSSLRESLRFAAIVDRFASNALPTGNPVPAFTLEQSGLIPEGLAWDPGSQRHFVSSVRRRSIYAIDKRGHASLFASKLAFAAFGMKVDGQRHVLWVAAGEIPPNKAAVLKLDLKTGRTLASYEPSDKEKHLFGDLTLAANGNVFVSDSGSPVIFKIADGQLSEFVRGPFANLQGLALSDDGAVLYAADYTKGIFEIDTQTRDLHPLPVPADASLLGVDGIYLLNRRTLIGVQNGTNPNRIVRMDLSSDGHRITEVTTLAANSPLMSDLTLGVLHDGWLFFNANGQWDLFDDSLQPNKDAHFENLRVLKIRVK
jgi:hypothetical protein